MAKDIILLTGQPGIDVRSCAQRVVDFIDGQARYLCIEDMMEESSELEFRSDILDACVQEQYTLWKSGFQTALNRLSPRPGEHVFLTFHAVYHHPRTRDFFSPVDLASFVGIRKRIKAVVVLIDDIFDIYTRLLRPQEIYADVLKQQAPDCFCASIENLLQILQWRQLEIAASRWIASFFRVPVLVLATKHHVRTLARITTTRLDWLRLLYLSHPITSVRQESESYPHFPGEVDEFARRLSKHENVVLFEPATIDEFGRFKRTDKGLLTPDLAMRWSLSSQPHETIAPPLDGAHRADWCLDPGHSYPGLKGHTVREIDRLLRLLEGQIGIQVGSRDFMLVEQADSGVVAYRPYYPDILSSGAWRELLHNKTVRELEAANRRKCLILSVDDDYCRHRVRRFFTQLQVHLDIPSARTEDQLQRLCDKWLSDGGVIDGFRDDLAVSRMVAARRGEIEAVLPTSYRFRDVVVSTPLGGTADARLRANRQAGFDVVCRETVKDDIEGLVVDGGVYRPRFESREALLAAADDLFRKVFRAA